MSNGILLMAHGSRLASANADLVVLAGLLQRELPDSIIKIGYLELAEPSIPTGGRQCVAAGATSVRMLPFFLSAGNHVVSDLEEFRSELAAEFPNVTFTICPPVGLHPLMLQILRDRLNETFVPPEPVPDRSSA
jgi:sirohydrochlorin ferrochelatase